eukprot:CAMPEP_0171098804 /NCGR_PEP_ID=MMETSP0766_2-20121228/49571_1 /TAXON_ID=439317 /ORGANISM="Gambierdiscus australes, Strain CAWD 149" /LENGTH=166 /DNA_ID=CAMNT_0011558263 /DNA_START=38 /DNA_END=535 /DNA_ORIENTATION=-
MVELAEEQVSEFRKAFGLFTTGDDCIDAKELKNVLSALGLNPSEADLKSMMSELGVEEDGKLHFPDFLQVMGNMREGTDTEEDLFNAFDLDRNGYISAGELRQVMELLGEKLTDAEVDQMMSEADEDDDGLISCDEFKRMIDAASEPAPAAPPQGVGGGGGGGGGG